MECMKQSDKLRKSLRVPILIDSDQVSYIVVSELISIRNAEVNRNIDKEPWDKVIRHYLSEDEFQKYVIE